MSDNHELKNHVFRCSEHQLWELAAHAVNASVPSSIPSVLAYLAHGETSVTASELRERYRGETHEATEQVHIDYYNGRMVKLYLRRRRDGLWVIMDPHPEYQSWSRIYPTAPTLIASVPGIHLLETVDRIEGKKAQVHLHDDAQLEGGAP